MRVDLYNGLLSFSIFFLPALEAGLFGSSREFGKEIANVKGKSCSVSWSGGDEDSVCGFGFVCLDSICKSDYSKPFTLLRDPTDQGPCDCASLLSAVHQLDDRLVAFTEHDYNSKSLKMASNELVSASQVRDCSSGSSFKQGFDFLNSVKFKGYSEYELPFNQSKNNCDNQQSLTKIRDIGNTENIYKIDRTEKCFSSSADLRNELNRNGPVSHHFYVYSEILTYPKLNPENNNNFEIISKSTEIFGSKYKYMSKTFEGFTNVVISGFGSTGYMNYFILKFHFGKAFGKHGYVLIEENFLFERYLPKCNSDGAVYEWKKNEDKRNFETISFPLRHFTNNRYEQQHPSELRNNIQNIINMHQINRPRFFQLKSNSLFLNSKTDFNTEEDLDTGELPNVKAAIKAFEKHLENDLNSNYNYAVSNVLYCELQIVSGRKLNCVFELRRILKSSGSASDFAYEDEAKNRNRGFDKDLFFYDAEVWFPLQSSNIQSQFTPEYYYSGTYLSYTSVTFVIVNKVAIQITFGPSPPPIVEPEPLCACDLDSLRSLRCCGRNPFVLFFGLFLIATGYIAFGEHLLENFEWFMDSENAISWICKKLGQLYDLVDFVWRLFKKNKEKKNKN